ncbi:TPM domain-containing protein [bacterium]|nr:TPM domain-containing protein [bacterium]
MIAALLLLGLANPSWASPPDRPASEVTDQAGILSSTEHRSVESLVQALNASGKVQMAILIASSLDGQDIESYALAVSEKWKLGVKGKDDGLLLVIAPNERRMRFEVGYGLEGDLSDIVTKRILSDTLAPYFREGRFRDGIAAAIAAAGERLGKSVDSGVETPPRRETRDSGSPLIVFIFFGIAFFMLLALSAFGRRHGHSWQSRGRNDYWGGGGGFGGGSWGGGGGGGFSGGGGSFGGGGSSSSW